MSLGAGAVYSTSKKQKLNTKSSTEAELVGVNDIMPQILWTRYFLEAQGYSTVTNLVINQDNQSAMLLEKNGRRSSSKWTRHINIQYFFVSDCVAAGKAKIQEYCPTKEMLADFFTKPLQGNLFRKFREVILGHKHIDSLKTITTITSQERVEKDSLSANKWDEIDGRKTDVKNTKPKKLSYAEITKKRKLSWKRDESSKNTPQSE